jgi:hypothetical protein
MNRCLQFLAKRAVLLAIVALTFTASALAAGPKKKILYSFTGGTDGGSPYAGFVADASGVLYSTTLSGGLDYCDGSTPCGVVFSFTPQPGGSWTESPIYSWDGSYPNGSTTGVVFDPKGNLYGTSQFILYQLTPPQGSGSWNFDTVYDVEGNWINDPVVDAAGNLYFTNGNVLELSPSSSGTWTTTTINVGGAGYSSLVMDKMGRLFGVIPNAGQMHCGATGIGGCGVVFEMTPEAGGVWNYRVIFEFSGNSTGSEPLNGLAIDSQGNLYGSAGFTNSKCAYGADCAIVFELSPPAAEGKPWTETRLHSFEGGSDGIFLYSTLSVDDKGAVYGTTYEGGSGFCPTVGCGTVFQLKPPAGKGEAWSESLYSFQGGSDGNQPHGSLLINQKTGALYGTTLGGGAYNQGTIFEIAFP